MRRLTGKPAPKPPRPRLVLAPNCRDVMPNGSVSSPGSSGGGGPVAGLVGIEVGVVSGVINLDSPGVEAPVRRPRHEECYQQA
jgi:hypothetical protein